MRTTIALWTFVLSTGGLPAAETGRGLGLDEFFAFRRISEIRVSPDGRHVVFVAAVADFEKNSLVRHLWLLPPGEAPRQLTNHPAGERSPAWAPDSRRIAFVSARDGTPQVWTISIEGGEARQVTRAAAGASDPEWSPSGDRLGFLSEIWPDTPPDPASQKKRADELEARGIRARLLEDLLYRHWDSWRDGKRTHLFVVPAEGGDALDLTPGESDVIEGSAGYAFSPDGAEVAFARSPVAPGTESGRNLEAWTTNADVWVVPVSGGIARCVTAASAGWDGSPEWSPDGRLLAWRSQRRDGYESDRFRIAILDRGTGEVIAQDLAPGLDRSFDQILWSPDSRAIYASGEDDGSMALWRLDLDATGAKLAGPPRTILAGKHLTDLSMPAKGGFLVGGIQTLTRPTEVAALPLPQGGGERADAPPRIQVLTTVNDEVLRDLRLPEAESVRYPGALGASIQAWLLRPPGYRDGVRHPTILFIHGGPQGAWSDSFHFRWNPALFAARGFVVLAPNPHGSTGFGQAFTEQISGDWGGACYEDVMKAADWAVEQGIADPERLGAMGGSYGGYLVNWILGHSDRFKALISHAGVYNLESMYGSTEELWFPEWEMGGPPWSGAESYRKFSPHLFAAKFRTPTLVIHGELDYRVPVTEGMQLFTALRRQGVEAKFLYYPDEGHWVAKPKNSRLWMETTIGWMEQHLGAAPGS